MRHSPRRRGMTLVEIMIAMAIMALMMMLAWTTIKSASNARVTYEALEDRNQEVRLAMARMVFDLEAAYLSDQEDKSYDNRRTYFIGRPEELRFSSFAHVTMWADSDESDQTVIAYYVDEDREHAGQKDLFRKELRRQSNEPWEGEPRELDILMTAVDKIEFAYWDWKDKKWQESWDSTKQDAEKDALPSRVKITVHYKTPRGDELVLTTQARLLLREQVTSTH